MEAPNRGNLPPSALQQVEAAALQLLNAVRAAKGDFLPVENSAFSLTVPDLVNEFLLAKARAGRAESYLALLLKQLRDFSEGREAHAAALVTAAQIEQWLYGNDWKPKTRRGALLTVRTLYQFAVARGYCAANPALGVDLPTVEPLAPGIHEPENVRAVLTKCADVHTVRFLAIRYFAGLRASEAAALAETEIHKEFIEVTAAKAKTRRRRLVTIQPNLRAWLDYTSERGGKLPLRQVNNRLCAAVKSAGVDWPQNVTRHSFCSYHLAQFGSAARTALEAGHSEAMLFGTYRELKTTSGLYVTPELAKEFWSITPEMA